MTFAGVPLAMLGGAALAGGAILISLYVLKLRRRRVEVAFARLWQQLLSDSESSALWRRLRRLLSLLLQLLLFALLLGALADPRPGDVRSSRSIAIVLDTSASMKTVEDSHGTTRLELAKKEARRVIDTLSDNELAVVVGLDAQPAALSPLTTDIEELRRAVETATSSDSPGDLGAALALADDVVARRPGAQIVLIGDGAYSRGSYPASATVAPLAFSPVGAATENLGITGFAARRYRANPSSYEILVDVRNESQTRRTAHLELLQDDELIAVEPIEIDPGATFHRIYSELSGSGTRLTARLRGTPADAFPVDDVAYALLPPRRAQRVLLVTKGNLFLEGALLLDSRLAVNKISPDGYRDDAAAQFDTVVFDGFTPDTPPNTNAFYVDPKGTASPFAIRTTLHAPAITDAAKEHPLTRWLALKDLNLAEASAFQLAPGDVAVASVVGKPIWAARTRDGRKTVALGFDVRRSDLPMRVAFPLLVINVLDWFEGSNDEVLDTYATGALWRIPTSSSTGAVTIIAPDGQRTSVSVRDGHVTYSSRSLGFYTLEAAGERRQIAASLISPEESRIRPRQTLTIGGQTTSPPVFPSHSSRKRLWLYLLAAALLLSSIEWWTYHRRVTV